MKMSKIEQEKAMNLIKEKYPEANFWYNEEEKTYNIAFNGSNSKVYSYKCMNTLQFLKRLKIVDNNVMYAKDYNYYLKALQKQEQKILNLKNGTETFYLMTIDEAIQLAIQEKNRLQNIVNNSIVLDI